MKYEDTIEIRGVTVTRETDVALLCRMGNQHRWIAPAQLQPGSTVTRLGDVGIVVLERPFAVEQGLVPFQGPHDPRCSDGGGHRAGKSAGGGAAVQCPGENRGVVPEQPLHRLSPFREGTAATGEPDTSRVRGLRR